MINIQATLYLLAFPIGLMGLVQAFFALLSLWFFDDHHQTQFLTPALLMLFTTATFLWVGRRFDPSKIKYRDALLFATLTWVICGVLGAVPIIYITGVSFTDGVFESVSALTTTGATVLSGLDDMPKSFLMYRQFLQWLGGLGVVIFVVAILPMLNVGGMKLLKAETPGPIKDDKLSPRISHTTQYLWLVYVSLTVLCAISYFIGGMDAFDAICHSFTTVSTGGFSTHDASMGYFQSPSLLLIADVFMLLGAISFALHFKVIRSRNVMTYLRDEETRTFLAIVLFLAVVIALVLLSDAIYHDSLMALNQSLFHLISFITSTGYGADSFTAWPNSVLLILVIAGYLGGCAGSTAGGNKIIRIILSFKLINLEVKRLIHPRAIFNVKYQGRPVESSILSATVAFMNVAAASTLVLTLLLMATGLDFWSALSGVAACLNVLGPGMGELGNNFASVSDAGIWVLSAAMILGRLEYFTVLALFLPAFWKY